MTFNPTIHHRRSIRLPGYDYSQCGAYFVTICIQNRQCLLGDIVDGHVQSNAAGEMVALWYLALEKKFPDIQCGDFVCMPNHIHCIVINLGHVRADPRVCPLQTGEHIGSPLPTVVQWFKTMTTNAYIHGVKQQAWPAFHKRLWQRNYYEHVIRNDADLERIQQYIVNNPRLWEQDTMHSEQQGQQDND